MHFTLTNQRRLIGFAARSSPVGEERAPVVFREFVTSEDGERLIQRLEGLSDALLAKAPPGALPSESQIDHLIALLHTDGRIEVWVNEPGFRAKMKVKRDVVAGEHVLRDDIADIAAMEPLGVEFPPDAGYVVLFSVGWRKGLAFDFSPLIPPEQLPAGTPRSTGEVPRLLGGLFTYLLFRNRFILTEDEWGRFFAERWFPFAGLPAELIDGMTQHARDGWPIDRLLPKVLEAVRVALPKTKALVALAPLFERHRIVLGDALSAFERGEFQLAAAGIYPRVEGLLREHHATRGTGPANPGGHALAKSATDRPSAPSYSLLLPLRFERYLTEVFFEFEDFTDPTKVTRATRHAVAHGVASDNVINEKAAAIGVLLLQQLAYLLPGESADRGLAETPRSPEGEK